MKKIYLVLIMVLCLGLVACGKTTGVVATSDLSGDNGQVVLINTDDLTQPPAVLDVIKNPSQVILSPDGSKAYACGATYPALGSTKVSIIDINTKANADLFIKEYLGQIRYVWDLALTADGTKLIVGTWSVISGDIEIYDTTTLDLITTFPISQNWLTDGYKWGRKLVLDPKREAIYLIATNGLTPQVRAYKFDGSMLGSGQDFDNDLLDLNNYDIAISPEGDLLMVASTKLFPYKVSDTGLEALNPIAGKGTGLSAQFYGKTKILFTKNRKMVYVNSAGLYVPLLFNISGSAYCLDRQKILANNPDPFVFSLVDFVQDDFIKWVVGLLSQDIENLIDPLQLYGIADSAIEGDTCYMIIASVGSTVFDLAGLQGGKYILAIFKTLPLIGNVWVGGKVIDTYPSNIAVNPANSTMMLSYFWKNQVGVFKRNPVLGWVLTDETTLDLGNYPKAMDLSTQKQQ